MMIKVTNENELGVRALTQELFSPELYMIFFSIPLQKEPNYIKAASSKAIMKYFPRVNEKKEKHQF